MIIENGNYCVYIHTLKIDGRIYVGQTCMKPEKRWNNGVGYKNCTYFYNAIKKYGWDAFEHEVIASNLTLDEANNFEALLIEKLDTINPKKGFNLRTGGKNSKLSDETKRKIGTANSGEKSAMFGKHGADNMFSKKVVQYDLDGNFIKVWDSIHNVESELGYIHQNIIKCCQGKRRSVNNFQWRYFNGDTNNIEKYKKKSTSKKNSAIFIG